MPLGFLALITVGTLLLKLPMATAEGKETTWLTALFTSTSASCVTGLIVVDTPTHYTLFGQGVILGLIQLGGLGIMMAATALALLITGKVSLQDAMRLRSEAQNRDFSAAAKLPFRVLKVVLLTEGVLAVVMTLRFAFAHDREWPTAIWHGIFHAISAFNNAGFSTYSTNLMGFLNDPIITGACCVGVIAGGLGFPFFFQIRHVGWRWRKWSIHIRITVVGTLILLIAGMLVLGVLEWNNPDTLGGKDLISKLTGTVSLSVMPRTAGFNSIDYAMATEETRLFSSLLMFIGGGSAGTAGGIKVTTFFLLAFVMWSEIRGYKDTVVWHRRLTPEVLRQALTVALLGAAAVGGGTGLLLMLTEGVHADAALMEVASAFGTVGLSANLTPLLPDPAKIMLICLMFVGRVGTVAVAAALAMNNKTLHYSYPTDTPLIG